MQQGLIQDLHILIGIGLTKNLQNSYFFWFSARTASILVVRGEITGFHDLCINPCAIIMN